jgi:hypothetical protein
LNKLEVYIINHLRKYYSVFGHNKNNKSEGFKKEEILSEEEGNNKISELIDSPFPLMVCRFGSVEIDCVRNYLQIEEFNISNRFNKYIRLIKGDYNYWHEYVKKTMHNNAGFFPATDEFLARFAKLFISNISNIDVLGVWTNEKYFHKNYCPEAATVPLKSIEPYYFNNPWSKKLQGKKVLVIHPFEESIKNQYKNRHFLFDNKNILPDFELQTIKAVQSIANNKTEFKDWFEAYDFMCEEILKKDFEIAIIGAGAYGMLLASFVKSIGKKSIHMAGATQILFGIRGKRWDILNKFVQNLYNDYWVYPLPGEKPENFKEIEGGCYW